MHYRLQMTSTFDAIPLVSSQCSITVDLSRAIRKLLKACVYFCLSVHGNKIQQVFVHIEKVPMKSIVGESGRTQNHK